MPNLDDWVFAPVMAGDWKQKEVWDGTYTIDDLFDWHEMNTNKLINQNIYQEWTKNGS